MEVHFHLKKYFPRRNWKPKDHVWLQSLVCLPPLVGSHVANDWVMPMIESCQWLSHAPRRIEPCHAYTMTCEGMHNEMTRHIQYNEMGMRWECIMSERRDRGIYSIGGWRSLYCLHFGSSQLIGPKACFEIFIRVLLGWLSNRSLCQIFSANPSLLYQAVGTQSKRRKIFSIWPFNLKGILANVCLRPHGLVQKGRVCWKCLVQASVA